MDTRNESHVPAVPDGFPSDPIETYLRPVLEDLAQQRSEAPKALLDALAPLYTIVRQLGQGGMATVYLAVDQSSNRQVAIKVLRPDVADAPTTERFDREIELTAALDHPHIVPIEGRGKAAGLRYYIMRHFEDGSLRERLDRSGPLSIAETMRIAWDVSSALDHAHAQGIIHCDIKPENILIEKNGAFVADFGIARGFMEDRMRRPSQTRLLVGTPCYMSPEQVDTGGVNSRSDIYALGCVVYEMLAGEPPFTGPDRRSVLAKHVTSPVPDLTLVREGMSPAIQAVVGKALSKIPAERYRSAGRFVAALEQAVLPDDTRRRSRLGRE